jgi:hypothetical protein
MQLGELDKRMWINCVKLLNKLSKMIFPTYGEKHVYREKKRDLV